MLAPTVDVPQLATTRIRCGCHQDVIVVHPDPWYRFQGTTTVELLCPACTRSLRPMEVAEGARARAWTLPRLPPDVAAGVSAELAGEVAEAQETPAEAAGELVWTDPHEPSAAYVRWVESIPAPLPLDRSQRIEAAVATVALVIVAVAAASF